MLSQILLTGVPMLAGFAGQIITILISTSVTLVPVAVARAKNIPEHIEILLKLLKDPGTSKDQKKLIALVLSMLTGIIPFITFSFIPFTGVPILTVP